MAGSWCLVWLAAAVPLASRLVFLLFQTWPGHFFLFRLQRAFDANTLQLGVTFRDDVLAAEAFSRHREHPWPSGRGRQGSYGLSPHAGLDLSGARLAWSWSHPAGRFKTITYGVVLDDESNLVLSAADAIRKFSADGALLWEHRTLPAENMNAPFLLDGAVYTCLTHGKVLALDLKLGRRIWEHQVSAEIAQDNGFVAGSEGVLVVAADGWMSQLNKQVVALNATSGEEIWRFKPNVPVWNFMGSFPADGTVLFQDLEGRGYRLGLGDGRLLWARGGRPGSWSDGTATLGPDGVFYTVNNRRDQSQGGGDAPGELSAIRVEDGALLWAVDTPRPANNAVAVGQLRGVKGRSVVLPMGQQGLYMVPMEVRAYDAETGTLQWAFDGPRQALATQADEGPHQHERLLAGVRPLCLPNGWSSPTIDATGIVWVGNQEGQFFALRDEDGSGIVDRGAEAPFFHTKGCFAGSSGPIVMPGLAVVATCDSLFVFKER